MEGLLNELIKRGWKPFGWDNKLSSLHKEYGVGKWYIRFHNGMDSELFDLRQLTSKESGLWQFVCENRMVEHRNYWVDTEIGRDEQYKYRLIESALRDEDKLEDFLLNSIKLD